MVGAGIQHVVEIGFGGDALGEIIEHFDTLLVGPHGRDLRPEPSGERAGEDCPQQEQRDADHVFGALDGEAVARRRVEEIVREEAEDARRQRRPEAVAGADHQHRDQVDHHQRIGRHQPERIDRCGDQRRDRRAGNAGGERFPVDREFRPPALRGSGLRLARNDGHLEIMRRIEQLVGHRFAAEPQPAARPGPADQQPRDIASPGKGDHLVSDTGIGMQRRRLGAERLGQLQRVAGEAPCPFGQRLVLRRDHRRHDPRNVGALGHAFAGAHQRLGERALVDADEDALLRRPRPLDGALPHQRQHLRIDPARRGAQRQFAQRREIGLGEEIVERPADRAGPVDLALAQPADQLLGRQVDELDLVGAGNDLVGDGLLHAHAADPRHRIVERFDVLDVERGHHVDAGVQHFDDILPALEMPRPWHIGVGELVDQGELRLAGEQRIEVELLELLAAIFDALAR